MSKIQTLHQEKSGRLHSLRSGSDVDQSRVPGRTLTLHPNDLDSCFAALRTFATLRSTGEKYMVHLDPTNESPNPMHIHLSP